MTRREVCGRGHPMVEGNFRWRVDGTRTCTICERARRKLRTEKMRMLRQQAKDAVSHLMVMTTAQT